MDSTTIFTDANGKPFERPEAPAPDADSETWIAYMNAVYAYNDAITSCAHQAFETRFRKAVR